jgi:UDPglucose--hexose-1-phosphate uridylyltransferase
LSSSDAEIRIDQLTGLRTILAAGRADRPIEFKPATREQLDEAECPFCEGNEERTPPEMWADRPGGGGPDSGGWRVRAVPNLYPAMGRGARPIREQREGGDGDAGEDAGAAESAGEARGRSSSPPADPLRASARAGEPDLFHSVAADGVHEVLIHSPRHRTALADLDDAELEAAVAGWRSRIGAHESASYVQLIVNEGGGAGASLEHSHSQIYALPFVPVLVARERERFTAYNQRTMGGDLLADILSEEVRRRERLVAIDDDAAVICPYASRGAYELRIIPRQVSARFEADDGVGVGALRTALTALRARFDEGLELNLWVRTAPRDADVFHWHIDIAPRLGIKAGFEFATGVDINSFPPERAAAELREALGS